MAWEGAGGGAVVARGRRVGRGKGDQWGVNAGRYIQMYFLSTPRWGERFGKERAEREGGGGRMDHRHVVLLPRKSNNSWQGRAPELLLQCRRSRSSECWTLQNEEEEEKEEQAGDE